MSLAEQIRDIEQRYRRAVVRSGTPREDEERFILATGWREVDAALGGGLTMAALHEWFGMAPSLPLDAGYHNEARNKVAQPLKGDWSADAWTPPIGPLVHLVRQAMNRDSFTRRVIWVGRRCFPYGGVLIGPASAATPLSVAARDEEGSRRLLEQSIFVTADRPQSAGLPVSQTTLESFGEGEGTAFSLTETRLWAVDLALRCRAVGIVVADGSGFDMAATRRIQLVAKAHHTTALLARPPWETSELSAAQTRWLVRWEANPGQVDEVASSFNPRWSVELLRCKGMQPDSSPRVWELEWDRVKGAVRLSTAVAHHAGDAGVSTSDRRLKHA